MAQQTQQETKPLVVFLPGTLCNQAVFQHLTSDGHDSLALKLSNEDSLDATTALIVQAAQGRPVILVGFSMGGMLAFDFIRQYPEQVLGLCLINSNCHADLPGRKVGRDQHLILAMQQGLDALMEQVYLPVYFSQPKSAQGELVTAMAQELGLEAFSAQLQILANRPDSTATLQQFNHPVLIIGSEDDLPCPVSHQQFMAEQNSNSELHIIPDAGHFALLEQGQDINKIFNTWLAKHYG